MWKCPKCGRSFSREGQDHYCGRIETVDQYIEQQDEKVRPYLNEIRRIIRSAIPEAQEKISWSMPTYWKGQNLLHLQRQKSTWDYIRAEKQPRFLLRSWRIMM